MTLLMPLITAPQPRVLPWALRRPSLRRLRPITASRSPDGELNWDPEGLFGQSTGGHIARRQLQRRMETDQEFASKFTEARTEIQKEAMARRLARVEPKDEEGFIEYFLNTDMEDMQYETIGTERFAATPNEDRLAELESLRSYLEEAVGVIDKAVEASSNVGERLKKLLISKDKKATILEMVAANEIDSMLIDFMDQNIEAAKTANETEKAEYMEKLKDACKRYS